MNAEFTFIRGSKTVRSAKICQLPFNSLTFEIHVLTMIVMTTMTMIIMMIMMMMMMMKVMVMNFLS
jgi:hypothetical protein